MIEDLLYEFNLTLHNGCGRFGNRPVRLLEDEGLFQVGEHDRTFDRWANSVELEFRTYTGSGIRKLRKWLTENS